MTLVKRFTLPDAYAAQLDIFIAGAGYFYQGVLDVPESDSDTLTAVRTAAPWAVETGPIDDAEQPPLPAFLDPYPEYLKYQELIDSIEGGSDAISSALRAAYGGHKAATAGFGLVGGGVMLNDLVTTGGSTSVTSAAGRFLPEHVGRAIVIIEGGATSSTLPGADRETHVTTIAAVTSATAATLTDAPTATLTAGEAYVVADDTAALQAWLASAPDPKRVRFNGYEQGYKGYGPGGNLILPPGVYGYSGVLELPQNSTVYIDGVTLVALSSSAVIQQRTRSDVYEQAGATLIGKGMIEGAYLSANGLRMAVSNQGKLSGFTVQRFTGNGIELRECQWVTIESVTSQYNGGYGVATVTNVSQACANIRLIGVRCQINGLGGWFAENTNASWAIGSTFQFCGTGYGIHIKGGEARGNKAIGCHFEGNKYHVYVQAVDTARPSDTAIVTPHFVISGPNATVGLVNGVERWVVNEGDDTSVSFTSSPDSLSSMTVTNGTNAPFQQSSASGSLVVLFPNIIGAGVPDFVCYEDGTPYREGNTSPYHSRVAIIKRIGRGLAFGGSFRFINPGTEGDLLRLQDTWFWLDSDGRLVSSAVKPSSQDEAGRSALSARRYLASRVDSIPAAVYSGESYTVGSKTLNNTATVQTDSALEIASVPAGRYRIEGQLVYTASANADFKMQLGVPTGATCTLQGLGAATSLAAGASSSNNNWKATGASGVISAGGSGTTSADKLVLAFTGFLEVTTPGSVNVKWAQNTAEASDVVVYPQSYLRLAQ